MDSCNYTFGRNGVRRWAVIRGALALFLVTTVTATASLKPSQFTLEPPQPPPSWNHSAEDLIRISKDLAAQIKEQKDIMGALAPQHCNFTSVILFLTRALAKTSELATPVYFYEHYSPFPELRNASAEARRLIDGVPFPLEFQKAIVNAEKNIKASGEWDKLSEEDKRVVEYLAQDAKDSGAALPDKAREEVEALRMELSNVTSQFMENFHGDNGVVSFTSAELKGVPLDVISGYRKRMEGLNEIYDVPCRDMTPIARFAEDPATRKRAYEAQEVRLAVNVPLVDKAADLRRKIANIFGYTSWANYVTKTRMIKNAKNVNSFLDDLESGIRPMALKERERLLAMKEAEHKEKGLPYDGQFYNWDFAYYDRKYTEKTVTLNDTLVKAYFPTSTVIPAILNIFQDLFSVRFEEVKGSSTWHPDVQLFAVWRKNATDASGFIGYCYLDLFRREFKATHVGVEALLLGYENHDGTWKYPKALVEAHLAKPTPGKPALMQHEDVANFFRDMAGVFQVLLSRTKYYHSHALAFSPDFLWAPSQMQMNWAWEPKVLKKISSHYQTKEPLSTDLINGIVKSRHHVNAGMSELRNIFLAKFDTQLHNAQESTNSTELWNALKDRITLLKSDKPGLGQGSFSDIMTGDGARYYEKLYPRVVAADMYATVFKADPLDPVRGAKFENAILRPGNTRNALESLQDFLGRPPRKDAFIRQLLGHAQQ